MGWGTKGRQAVWFTWFSLLMGAPYVPHVFSPDGIAGASSLSSIFAWISLGLLFGVWLSLHPSVRAWHGRHEDACSIAVGVALAASTALVLTTWLHVLAFLAASWQGPEPGGGFRPRIYGNALYMVTTAMLRFAVPVSFASSFVCGSSMLTMVRADDDATHRSWGGRAVAVSLMLFLLGALQPLAWTLLLPHSPFPQPLIYAVPVSSSGDWQSLTVAVVLPSVLSYVLIAAVTRLGVTTDRSRDAVALMVLSFCAGGLAFRLVGRIGPSLYGVSHGEAVVGLAVYLVLLLATCFACTRLRAGNAAADIRQRLLKRTLTRRGRAFLDARGLTSQEMLAFCSSLRGYTSAYAAEVIGVKSSTVREYRRRCAVKLGVPSVEGIPCLMPPGSLAVGGTIPEKLSVFISASVTTGASGCALLLALPFGGVIRSWSDVWVRPTGIGIGILLALATLAAIRLLRNGSRAPAGFVLSVSPILVGGSIVIRMLVHDGTIALSPGQGADKLVGLACSTCAAFGLTCALAYGLILRNACGAGISAGSAFATCSGRRVVCTLPVLVTLPMLLAITLGGRVAWAVSLYTMFSMLTVGMCAWVISGRLFPSLLSIEPLDDRQLSLKHLIAAFIVAWSWAETWRAQSYTSLSLVLSYMSAITLIMCLAGNRRRVSNRGAGVLLACGAMVLGGNLLGSGGGVSLMWLLLLLLGCVRVDGRQRQAWGAPGCCCVPWFSPLAAVGSGLILGPVITNAYGFGLLNPGVFGGYAVEAALNAALIVGTAMVLVACALMEPRQEGWGTTGTSLSTK